MLRDGENDVFIGLNDSYNPGQWVWQDGSALGSYKNWVRSSSGWLQPDGSGDCVLKRYDENGAWDDVSCEAPKKFACRMAAKERTGCTYSCSDPRFKVLGNKCFYVSSTASNYTDAQDAC